MPTTRGFRSMFQQNIDRALFASYCFGAVLPLLVLSWLVHTYALPTLSAEGYDTATVLGVLCGAGVLVLSGYFATRQIAATALAQINSDNERLEELLETARALAGVEHAEEATTTAARCALVLSGADAAFVVGCEKEEAQILTTAGAESDMLATGLGEQISELAEAALCDGRPASLTFDGPHGAAPARATALAVPIPSASTPSALVVLRASDEARLFSERDQDALATLAGIASVALDNADLQHTQRNFFAHVTDMLVMALDAHVDRRSGHANRVAELANRVARELALDEETIRRIHFAALLHDLGMLKIERRASARARAVPQASRDRRAHDSPHPLVARRGARRVAPPRALRRIGLSQRTRRGGHPARVAHRARRRRVRCDDARRRPPPRPPARGSAAGAARRHGIAVRPPCRARLPRDRAARRDPGLIS